MRAAIFFGKLLLYLSLMAAACFAIWDITGHDSLILEAMKPPRHTPKWNQ